MDDTISRAAALKGLEDLNIASFYEENEHSKEAYTEVKAMLKSLPSAQPKRKKGKWIGTEYDGFADGCPVYYEWKCSVCTCVVEDEEPTWNFCPNCGADMRGEQE